MGLLEGDSHCSLACDLCGCSLETEEKTVFLLRSIAKKEGWKFRNDDWVCFKCLKKNKNNNKTSLKRSPLKPTSNKLKKTPLKKSKASINRISETQKKKNEKYYKLRDIQLRDYPVCEFPGCYHQATDVHHVRGRDGKNRYGPFRSLCRLHHSYIEEHKQWAKENGFSESRFKKD